MSRERSPPPYPIQSSGSFHCTLKTNSNNIVRVNDHNNKHQARMNAIGRLDEDVRDGTPITSTIGSQIDLEFSENPGNSVLPTCLDSQFTSYPGFDCNYRLLENSLSQLQNARQSPMPSKNNNDFMAQLASRPHLQQHQQSHEPSHQYHNHHQQQLVSCPSDLRHLQQFRNQLPMSPCQDGFYQPGQRHVVHYQHQPPRQIKPQSNHNSFEGRPWSSNGACFHPSHRNFSLPNSPLLSQRHHLRQPPNNHQPQNYQQEALYRRLLQHYPQQNQRQPPNYDPLYYDYCLHASSNGSQQNSLTNQQQVAEQAQHQLRGIQQQKQQQQLRKTQHDSYRACSMIGQSSMQGQTMQRPQSAYPQLDTLKYSEASRQPIEENIVDEANIEESQDQSSYDHPLYLYLRRQSNNNNNNLGNTNDYLRQIDDLSQEHLELKPECDPGDLQDNASTTEEETVLKQLPLLSLKINPDSMIGQLLASSKQLTLQQKPPLAQSQQQQPQQQSTKQNTQPHQQQTKLQLQQQNKAKDPPSQQLITQRSAKPVTSTTPRPSFLPTSQPSTIQSLLQSGKKVVERRGSKGSPTSTTAPSTPTSTSQLSFPKRTSPPKNPMTASSSNGSLADSPVSVTSALKSNANKTSTGNNHKILAARKGSAPPLTPATSTLFRGSSNLAGQKQLSKMTLINSVKSSAANAQVPLTSKKSSSPPMSKSQAVRKSSAPNPCGSNNGVVPSNRIRHSSASSNGNSHNSYNSTNKSVFPAARPTNLSTNGVVRLNGNLIPKSNLIESQIFQSSAASFLNSADGLNNIIYKTSSNDQPPAYSSKLGILPEDSVKNESLAEHFTNDDDEDDDDDDDDIDDGADEEVIKDSSEVLSGSLFPGALDQLHQTHYQPSTIQQQQQQMTQLKPHLMLKRQSHQQHLQQIQQQQQQPDTDCLVLTQQQQLMLQEQQNYHLSLQQGSNLSDAKSAIEAPKAITSPIMTSTPKPRMCESSTHLDGTIPNHVTSGSRSVVEQLSDENKILRKELENYYKKNSNLEKHPNNLSQVEREIERMGRAYESLVNQTERRENLERVVRLKLESEVIRLNEDNKDFKDQLQQCLVQLETLNESLTPSCTPLTSPTQSLTSSSIEVQQKKELQRKDAMLMKLLKQNHTLMSAKSELEFEASVLRRTLDEQKKQMSVLKLSLAQAQAASNKYFIELENFRSREASIIHIAPQQPNVSNDNNNNYFDSYFVDGIQYDNRFFGGLKSPHQDEKKFSVDECDTDDGISSDSSSVNNNNNKDNNNSKWMTATEIQQLLQNWEQKYSKNIQKRRQERIGCNFDESQIPSLLPTQTNYPKSNFLPLRESLISKRFPNKGCTMSVDDQQTDDSFCVCGSCKHGPQIRSGTNFNFDFGVGSCGPHPLLSQGGWGNDPEGPNYPCVPASPSSQTMIINEDDDDNDLETNEDDDDDVQF